MFAYTRTSVHVCVWVPYMDTKYICECKQRVSVCMCIFTYMSSRLDVGVYIGWVGTQSLYVDVSVCVCSHGVTCGFKCFYVFTYIHTEFTHVWVYILTYILPGFTCA